MSYAPRGIRTLTPQGFQTYSEGAISDYGATLDKIAGLGAQTAQAGQGMYGQGLQRMNAIYGGLAGAGAKTPNWLVSQAAIDAQAASDQQQGAAERRATRMGVNPNSGRFQGLGSGGEAALNKAAAMTLARRSAANQQFGNLLSLAGLAQGQQSHGAGLAAQGAGILQGAGSGYSNLSGIYGGLAQESRGAQSLPYMQSAQSRFMSQPSLAY
jgi:hypothetical protein